MRSEVKVSVCVVTYNQENYIAECLQSLVDQKTDFPFEIIVGDDCSTDKTREIVENFAVKYPDIIVRNYHEFNIGAVKNAISTYELARGEYLCHIDGDDGALPGKLKFTSDILDQNPDCVMVTHDAMVVDGGSKKVRDSLKAHKTGIYDSVELIRNLPFFTNSTKMVRRQACIKSISLLCDNAIDVELHLLESRFGNIYHVNSPLGYYRVMVGVSSANKRVNSLIVEGYVRVFDSLIDGSVVDIKLDLKEIKTLYAKVFLNFSYQSIYFGRLDDAKRFCSKSISLCLYSPKQIFIMALSYLGFISVFLARARDKLK